MFNENLYYNNITTLTILTTTKCNLMCKYCYANGGSYNFQKKNTNWECVKKFIDKSFEIFPNINTIKFFGGEPFINFPLIERVINYVKKFEKNIIYGLSTNGSILNKSIISILKNNNIALSISLDGEKKIHNFLRPYANGDKTFNKIIRNIKKLKENNINFAIEATYTPNHLSNNISLLKLTKYLNSFSKTVKIQPVFIITKKDFIIEEDIIFEQLFKYIKELAVYTINQLKKQIILKNTIFMKIFYLE